MSIFEAGMLICFGFAWPVSIYKVWKSKKTGGKSPIFIIIVMIGYTCGIIHKFFYNYDLVLYLYILNLIMVSVDLSLYFYYSKREHLILE